MGLADHMREHDAVIFAELGEVLTFGTNQIPGCFFRGHRDYQFADGQVVGLQISFDCQWDDALGQLERGDTVQVLSSTEEDATDYGSFQFQRIVDRDESGLTVLELGSIL